MFKNPFRRKVNMPNREELLRLRAEESLKRNTQPQPITEDVKMGKPVSEQEIIEIFEKFEKYIKENLTKPIDLNLVGAESKLKFEIIEAIFSKG